MPEHTTVDTWLSNLKTYLEEKYNLNVGEYASILRVSDRQIVVSTDLRNQGRIIAAEFWESRGLLEQQGIGIKVVTGGKVLGDSPPVDDFPGKSMMIIAQDDVFTMTDSRWLKRESRGIHPNLQRVESLQRNDGSVYIVSANAGDNNVIKGVFPYLGLQKVLSAPAGELTGKQVGYVSPQRMPGDDDPAEIGRIRARVIRNGVAEGHYQEAYEFMFNGIKYKMQCEYFSLESEEEALVVVRNLDLFQKGYWHQVKESLS